MYGLTPFGGAGFDLWNAFNDFDKSFFGSKMPINNCRTDIRDAGDKYIMEAELAGFDKEDISLDISGEQLTITAERRSDSGEKDDKGNYIRRERSFGSYKRSFGIGDVNAEAVSAEYKNGILTIELPKKAPEAPVSKRLEIR